VNPVGQSAPEQYSPYLHYPQKPKAPHKNLWVKNSVDAQGKEGLRCLFAILPLDSMLTHKFLQAAH
jgi:hypothetical protein